MGSSSHRGGPCYQRGMLVRIYARPGCHLSDVAREVIEAERGRTGFTFEEISVEGDDRLELEYGIRIPVVAIDGRESFEIEVDPEEFAALVRA